MTYAEQYMQEAIDTVVTTYRNLLSKETLLELAVRLCDGVVEYDAQGQAIIYTGIVDPNKAELPPHS